MSKYIGTKEELRELIDRRLAALSPEQLQALASMRGSRLAAVEAARKKLGWPVVGLRHGKPYMTK